MKSTASAKCGSNCGGRAARSPPTVLAVDDEPSVLEAVRLELEDDFHVVTASSGRDALDLLEQRHVDAVVLDLRMPEMTGEEVLGHLRAQSCPVIVMTVVDELRPS